MYAHLITCFGWTWDYIAENIDLVRLKAILDSQSTYPPLHQMVAAYLGIEAKNNNKEEKWGDFSTEENDTSDEDFLASMGIHESAPEFGVRTI